MTESQKRLNKKRLIAEISIFGAVILGIILWRFLPWFFVQELPGSSDRYSQYKHLYNDVISYDFSKGPSESLEKRLNRAVDNFTSTEQHYFDLKARVEYNYRLGRDSSATIQDLEEAQDYAPDESEEEYIQNLLESLNKN